MASTVVAASATCAGVASGPIHGRGPANFIVHSSTDLRDLRIDTGYGGAGEDHGAVVVDGDDVEFDQGYVVLRADRRDR